MKDLAKRLSVALWGIPLLVFLTYQGGYFFAVFVWVVNAMAIWEFYKMFENQKIYAHKWLGAVVSSLFLLVAFIRPLHWQVALFGVLAVILVAHLRAQKGMASTNTVYTAGGFAYITMLLFSLLAVRENFAEWAPGYNGGDIHLGGWFVMVLLASIWICDTAAYFGGRAMGKHKLAPNVSPNKTVEGAAFGFVFAILSFWGFTKWWLPALPESYAIASGAIVGIFGQIGDLVESRFKRDAGVKDTSTLLPGHGGILDRFDSLMFVSPFIWALFYYRLLGA